MWGTSTNLFLQARPSSLDINPANSAITKAEGRPYLGDKSRMNPWLTWRRECSQGWRDIEPGSERKSESRELDSMRYTALHSQPFSTTAFSKEGSKELTPRGGTTPGFSPIALTRSVKFPFSLTFGGVSKRR